mgnify:CR=1 FL=1
MSKNSHKQLIEQLKQWIPTINVKRRHRKTKIQKYGKTVR